MGSHALEYPASCQLCLARFKNATLLANHACIANKKTRLNTPPTTNSNDANPNVKISQNNSKIDTQPSGGKVQEKTGEKPTAATASSATTVSGPSDGNSRNHATNNTAPTIKRSFSIFEDEGSSLSDPEEIFEAAQNPVNLRLRLRSKSNSIDNSAGNPSDTSDFLVTDPWQACSAIAINNSDSNSGEEKELNEEGNENDIIAPEQTVTATISSSLDSPPLSQADKFINELIGQPVLPQPPKRERPSTGTSAPGRTRPESVRISLRQNAIKATALKEKVQTKDLKENIPESVPISVSVLSTSSPPRSKTVNNTNAQITFANAPLTDVVVNMRRGSGSDDPLRVDPNQDLTKDLSPEGFVPIRGYICTKCHRTFNNHVDWAYHLVTKHITCDPKPVVLVKKLDVVDVDVEVGLGLGMDVDDEEPPHVSVKSGNKSKPNLEHVSPKSLSKSDLVSEKERKLSSSSTSPTQNAGEPKKGAIKLTLFRSAGQFSVKRKLSIEGVEESPASSSATTTNSEDVPGELSPDSRRSSTASVGKTPTHTPPRIDSIAKPIPENTLPEAKSNPEKPTTASLPSPPNHTETSPSTKPNPEAPPSDPVSTPAGETEDSTKMPLKDANNLEISDPKPAEEAVDKPKPTFRPRFMQAAQLALKKLKEQREQQKASRLKQQEQQTAITNNVRKIICSFNNISR